jgi:hypothetical protein
MPLPLIIGAIALGTAAFGAKKGYDGYQKHSEADDIVKSAQGRYDRKRVVFDEQEGATTKALELLGKKELEIGAEIGEFQKIATKLIEKLKANGQKNLKLSIPKHQLEKIENYSYTAVGVLGSVAGAGAAGAAAGFAVYGGVMALGAASTGTAISSLAGAAATKATLAAIGGGSLATGGMGIAGGTAILGAAVAAPILAIAGWAYDSHGDEALTNARKAGREVDAAISKMGKAMEHLEATQEYANKIKNELIIIHEEFSSYFVNLQEIDNFLTENALRNLDEDAKISAMSKLSEKTSEMIQHGYEVVAIMVDLITTPIFKFKKINGEVISENDAPILEKDANGFNLVNSEELDIALREASNKFLRFHS